MVGHVRMDGEATFGLKGTLCLYYFKYGNSHGGARFRADRPRDDYVEPAR